MNEHIASHETYLPLRDAAALCGLKVTALAQRCKRGMTPHKREMRGKKTFLVVRPCDIGLPIKQKSKPAEKLSPTEGRDSQQKGAAEMTTKPTPEVAIGGVTVGKVPKKPTVEKVKNSMRKFNVAELLNISTWINGRIFQQSQGEPKAS